ncbi:hypothetical protein, partial [Paraburkholderia sp. Ac-20347]|uniref:hypothetical protein n=1 Tax=Paraburkholderia sp. Ac-20347 TaxID=2703892 RepID=UPI0019823F97
SPAYEPSTTANASAAPNAERARPRHDARRPSIGPAHPHTERKTIRKPARALLASHCARACRRARVVIDMAEQPPESARA